MTISPEVQAAVARIHSDNDLISSLRAASALQGQQLSDIQAKYDALLASDAADHLSGEDKAALQAALDDAQSTNSALPDAVQANTGGAASQPAPAPVIEVDRSVISGPSAADGGPPVPLMPTAAFDPGAGNKPLAADAGQPQQPKAIETPGGFVIAGGGATSRAVGSVPDSPSSSVVVPEPPAPEAPQDHQGEAADGGALAPDHADGVPPAATGTLAQPGDAGGNPNVDGAPPAASAPGDANAPPPPPPNPAP